MHRRRRRATPSTSSEEPDVARLDRPPRARPRTARGARRSRSPSRSRRSARPDCPGPVHRLRRAARAGPRRTTTTTTSTRGWRPSGLPGRRRRRRASRLPSRSDVRRPRPTVNIQSRRSHARRAASTGGCASKGAALTMGVPKRRVSHARQGDRRAHLALDAPAARGVPALPPAEAQPSRLPELRLLRRPAGPRDQGAEGRRPPRPDPWREPPGRRRP